MGMGRLPGVPGDTTRAPLLNNRSLWILNLRPEEEQEAAWKFLKWLMEPEQQAEWSAGSGYLPASHAALDLPAVKDIDRQVPAVRGAPGPLPEQPYDARLPDCPARALLAGPRSPPPGGRAMLSGAQDPDQALESAAADSNRIIEEYNQRVKD